jgi:hypothetical protein
LLIDDMVAQLETPAPDEPPNGLVSECNVALADCLEHLRDVGEGDERVGTARDDLHRFSRLLKLVDGPDVLFVMQQIRRVLGRFGVCNAHLLELPAERPGTPDTLE